MKNRRGKRSSLASCNAAFSFKNVRNRIVSFCDMKELKTLEKVCKLTNNGQEVQDIVEAIRKGLVASIKTTEEITEIRDALTHLCYMTEKLNHAADIHRRQLFVKHNACEVITNLLRRREYLDHPGILEEACWAIQRLAREKEATQRLIKENVHKLICDFMAYKEFVGDVGIQTKALGAIVNLTIDPESVKLLLDEQVCEKVLRALRREEFMSDRELQMFGLRSVSHLAWFKEATNALIATRPVDTVVKSLHNPVVLNCHTTLEIAISAIGNLTIYTDYATDIMATGAHKVMMAICRDKKNKDVASLHTRALATCMNLMRGEGGRRYYQDFFSAGICELVRDELTNKKFAREDALVENAVKILASQVCNLREVVLARLCTLDMLKHIKAVLKLRSKPKSECGKIITECLNLVMKQIRDFSKGKRVKSWLRYIK